MAAALVGVVSGAGVGVAVVIYLALAVLFIVGWVKILNKAGYSGWWVLIGIVPLVNIVMFLVFAFGDWPSLRNQRSLGEPPYPPYPAYPPVGWNPGQPGSTSWPGTQAGSWPGGSQAGGGSWPGGTQPGTGAPPPAAGAWPGAAPTGGAQAGSSWSPGAPSWPGEAQQPSDPSQPAAPSSQQPGWSQQEGPPQSQSPSGDSWGSSSTDELGHS